MRKASYILVVILICACLFKGETVNAITQSMLFSPTGKTLTPSGSVCNWVKKSGTTYTQDLGGACEQANSIGPITDWNQNLRMIKTRENMAVEEGLYYEIDLRINSNFEDYNIEPPVIWTTNTNEEWFSVVGFQEVYSGAISVTEAETPNLYLYMNFTNTGGSNPTVNTGSGAISEGNGSSDLYINTEINTRRPVFSKVYQILLMAKKTGNVQPQIGLDNYSYIFLNGQDNLWRGYVSIRTVTEYKREDITKAVNSINQDQQNAGEQAQTDGDASGAESQNQAENTSNTLFGLFKNFVQALSGANASNCKISGDIGHINMGELDFCKTQPPAFIQVIGSLIAVMICVPLSVIMTKRLINLFRSFQ